MQGVKLQIVGSGLNEKLGSRLDGNQQIADECKPLEEAILRAEDEIKLIREYRDRQIADVVTGQVDVRGWVPGPDDVVAEEDLAVLGGDEETDTDGEKDDGDD